MKGLIPSEFPLARTYFAPSGLLEVTRIVIPVEAFTFMKEQLLRWRKRKLPGERTDKMWDIKPDFMVLPKPSPLRHYPPAH